MVDVTSSTDSGIEANMRNLALYAGIAQSAGIVPMVEPEVLYDGTHTIHECNEKMRNVLTHLFGELVLYKVDITGVILKTSFVLSGKKNGEELGPDEVAQMTVEVLHSTVPKNIGGVVFLSGGQTPTHASDNLSRVMKHGPHPFPITFSYSRAIQDPVLQHFASTPDDIDGARGIFEYRLKMNQLALDGKYNLEDDTGAVKSEQVGGSQDL